MQNPPSRVRRLFPPSSQRLLQLMRRQPPAPRRRPRKPFRRRQLLRQQPRQPLRSRQRLPPLRHRFVLRLRPPNPELRRLGRPLRLRRGRNLLPLGQRHLPPAPGPHDPVHRHAQVYHCAQQRRRGPPETEVPCQREIAGRYPTFRGNVRVARGLDSRCAPSQGRAGPWADKALRAQSRRGRLSTGEGHSRPAPGLGRVLPDGPGCCRRCRKRCRRRRNPESRSTHARLHRASAR